MNGNADDSDNSDHSVDDTVGYDYEFEPSLDNKHMCPICLLALRDPVQTLCGHRFCKPCIMRCIRIRKSCPVDQSPLNENQIFQDNYAQREVLDLNTKCPHKGCEYTSELRHIAEHASTCTLRKVACKNGCGLKLLLKDVTEHEEKKCPRRVVECSVCQTQYPMDCEEVHEEECKQQLPVECEYCGREIKRYKLHSHITTECLNAPIKCVFEKVGCFHQLARRNVKEHMEQSTQIHLQYLLRVITGMQTHTNQLDDEIAKITERFENIIQETTTKEKVTNSEIEFPSTSKYQENEESASEKEYDDIDIAKMENKMKMQLEDYQAEAGSPGANNPLLVNYNETSEKIVNLDHHVRELMAKMETQISQMKDFTAKLTSVEEKIDAQQLRCCNGLYFWRIKDYTRLRHSAKIGDQPVLHSPGFYTSPQGYKMCVRVNLDGVESAQGTHLSLFVHLMKGDYDDLLPWPFKGIITLTVINQRDIPSERSHVSETLQAQANLSAFQRPTSDRNQKGYGYIDYFPLPTLESEGFIKDDTLVIKAQVMVDFQLT